MESGSTVDFMGAKEVSYIHSPPEPFLDDGRNSI
jgi:hypothetical protein